MRNDGPAADLVLYRPRKKLLLPVAGCGVFVAIGASMVANPTTTTWFPSETVIRFMGVVGLGFFGLGLVSLIVRFLNPLPILRIDDAGLTNRTNLASVPFLTWSEISGTHVMTTVGKEVLVVEAKDSQAVLSRCRSPLRRRLAQRSHTDGFGVCTIPEPTIPGELADIQAMIDRRLDEVVRDHDSTQGIA